MFMIPTAILPLWFLAIWFYGLIAGGIYLLRDWYRRAWLYDPSTHQRYFHPILGWNHQTLYLASGLVLLLLPMIGGVIITPIIRAFCRKEPSDKTKGTAFPEPRGETQRIARADGSEIQVECHGPEDGLPIILTHGWGTNRTEWEYLRRDLDGQHCRLITWDLPGLGDSNQPKDRDFSLENLARDLELVRRTICPDRPVILAGHSIGGMITLTFCRDFPEALGSSVAGLILVNTTYTNPVRTTKGAALMSALEKPLLIPLQYLAIALSPLLRISNVMSYANGVGHLGSLIGGFAGTQSWEELDFSTRFSLNAPPAVISRGLLGMTRYDATSALSKIAVPTLIVTGDRDSSCKPDASEFMKQKIPNSQLVTLSPANHMALMEHHNRFAGVVSEFLTSINKS